MALAPALAGKTRGVQIDNYRQVFHPRRRGGLLEKAGPDPAVVSLGETSESKPRSTTTMAAPMPATAEPATTG
jgi:hypothetical protein